MISISNQPIRETGTRNAHRIGEFVQRVPPAAKIKDSRIASIRHLLCGRGPLAILGGIRPVCVDAIDRVMARRCRSHVLKERVEIGPARTHPNASAAVIGIRGIPRVLASSPHALPNLVLARVRQAVGEALRPQPLRFQAAAAFGASVFQITEVCRRRVTAIAPAIEQHSTVTVSALTDADDGQQSESLSDRSAGRRCVGLPHTSIVTPDAPSFYALKGQP